MESQISWRSPFAELDVSQISYGSSYRVFQPQLFPVSGARGFSVSQADMQFGAAQVERMMADRPLMKRLVKRGDIVYEWAARHFAGASCGLQGLVPEGRYWPLDTPNRLQPGSGKVARLEATAQRAHRTRPKSGDDGSAAGDPALSVHRRRL